MKIAIAQINTVIGDFPRHFRKIVDFAGQAKDRSCDLIVFPEMVVSGYPPQDLLENDQFIQANLDGLNHLVKTIQGIGVVCGFVDRNPTPEGKALFNGAALFEDGKILIKTYKKLLPTYDVFDETRYFEPGTDSSTVSFRGKTIGITICEDVWNDKDIFKRRVYRVDPVADIIRSGADMIVNISASPFSLGKREFRWEMLSSIARKYRVPMVYANQVGGNDSVLFDGIGMAFDSQGKICARASDFVEDMVVFDMDAPAASYDAIHPICESRIETLYRSLVMGTRDYVTKCGFSKVLVGLSGGVDSALTACIACEGLGRENLLTVFMPSRYTSRDNYEDTRQLADNLGVDLKTIPIDRIFKEFIAYLSPDFNPDDPGITEQNIQARIRGTLLMGLSNRDGSILLATGNKSELAVGYCTLYGDMNGGLAVISDVPKTMVYDLCRYINRDRTIIPERIIEKAPSAELKPGQEDQDDLPPYDVLDTILKGYIEDYKNVDELIQMGYERDLVENVIARVDTNEYKRQQAAPGLKVTSKAFGYGRRHPLAKHFKRFSSA